jgi:MYXO-CTERM domain-containing protein
VQLASFLKSDVPELAMTAQKALPAPSAKVDTTGPATAAPEKKGCAGCATSPASGAAPFGLVALALLLLGRRKKG